MLTNAALGRGLILLSIALAAAGAIVGFWGGRRRTEAAHQWSKSLAYSFGFTLILANVVMIKALLEHDFSVGYVAQVGSLATPTHITIVSAASTAESHRGAIGAAQICGELSVPSTFGTGVGRVKAKE